MKRSGYNYRNLDEAESDPRWNPPGGAGGRDRSGPSQTEIAVSVTDKRCRESTNISGVLQGLIGAYQARMIEARSEELRSVKTTLQRRLRNAADYLAHPPTGSG